VIPFVSACVVIPLGSEIDQGQIIEFHPGTTHRSEVIEQIGEPNIFSGGGFDVYHLEEGRAGIIVFFLGAKEFLPDEIYNLVFHYDANGLLEELRYERSLDADDPDLIILDNDFTGKVKDFTVDGEYNWVYISADGLLITAISETNADGRKITAISETNIVIQSVEGESRVIDLEQTNFASLGYGRDCAIDLHNHHTKKQNSDFNWLSGIQDIRPLYKLCIRPPVAFDVTADGSGLALANANQLEFLLQAGDVMSAPEADQEYIRHIWFVGMDDYVVTNSVGLDWNIFFIKDLKDPLAKTELKIRSLPSLHTIETIRRPFVVGATAMSRDHKLFALVSYTHVELWHRIKELGEPSGSDGHYELSRVTPIKPIRGNIVLDGYLSFSPDGEYLMWVGYWEYGGDRNGQLYLWDTDDGRPVAEVVNIDGLLEAAFNQNNEIVIVSGQEDWASSVGFTSRKYQSLKIRRLPLETLRGN